MVKGTHGQIIYIFIAFFLVILLLNNSAKAQENKIDTFSLEKDFPDKHAFQFNLIGLNLSYLHNLRKGFVGKVTMGPDFAFGARLGNFYLIPTYQLLFDIRYYPLLKGRVEKGKSLHNFPGFYISGYTRFFLNNNLPEDFALFHTLFALTGGYRVPMGKIFFFDIQAGAAQYYTPRSERFGIGPALRTGIGLSFTKPKK